MESYDQWNWNHKITTIHFPPLSLTDSHDYHPTETRFPEQHKQKWKNKPIKMMALDADNPVITGL